MTTVPIRVAESETYVHYTGYVDEYPINFRVNKNTLSVEVSLTDLVKAKNSKNRRTVANLLLQNEETINQFLDLLNTEV